MAPQLVRLEPLGGQADLGGGIPGRGAHPRRASPGWRSRRGRTLGRGLLPGLARAGPPHPRAQPAAAAARRSTHLASRLGEQQRVGVLRQQRVLGAHPPVELLAVGVEPRDRGRPRRVRLLPGRRQLGGQRAERRSELASEPGRNAHRLGLLEAG